MKNFVISNFSLSPKVIIISYKVIFPIFVNAVYNSINEKLYFPLKYVFTKLLKLTQFEFIILSFIFCNTSISRLNFDLLQYLFIYLQNFFKSNCSYIIEPSNL